MTATTTFTPTFNTGLNLGSSADASKNAPEAQIEDKKKYKGHGVAADNPSDNGKHSPNALDVAAELASYVAGFGWVGTAEHFFNRHTANHDGHFYKTCRAVANAGYGLKTKLSGGDKYDSADFDDGSRDKWREMGEVERTEYVCQIVRNSIALLPFLFVHRMKENFIHAWRNRKKEREPQEGNLLKRTVKGALHEGKMLFRDLNGCFLGSLFDVSIERIMDTELRDIPGDLASSIDFIDNYLLGREHDGIGRNGFVTRIQKIIEDNPGFELSAKSLEALGKFCTEKKLAVGAGNSAGYLSAVRDFLNTQSEKLKKLHKEISENSHPDAKLSSAHANRIHEINGALGAVSSLFMNFTATRAEYTGAEPDLNAPKEYTGIEGGLAAYERRASRITDDDSASLNRECADLFRQSSILIGGYRGALERMNPGVTHRGSKTWHKTLDFLEQCGLPRDFVTTWLIAGTAFGPGFNVFRYVGYDIFDNFIWPDKDKKKDGDEPDTRTFGEKISQYMQDKVTIAASVYAGAVGIAAGSETYKAGHGAKQGRDAGYIAAFEEMAGEFATKHGLLNQGGINRGIKRIYDFFLYIQPRALSKDVFTKIFDKPFEILGNIIDAPGNFTDKVSAERNQPVEPSRI